MRQLNSKLTQTLALSSFALVLLLPRVLLGAVPSAEVSNVSKDLETKDYPVVFKDMGVVQNKAMNKRGRFIALPAFSVDFSDGPFSMYGVGARLGYAISDFWEIYGVANPKFISQKRGFIRSVETAVAEGAPGSNLVISGGIAQSEYGLQLLWAPLYGKDSLGISRVIRSDTFLRLGLSQIKYDIGSGIKLGLGAGKTFFIGKSMGFRVLVEEGYVQTIYLGKKAFNPVTFVESGFAFYL